MRMKQEKQEKTILCSLPPPSSSWFISYGRKGEKHDGRPAAYPPVLEASTLVRSDLISLEAKLASLPRSLIPRPVSSSGINELMAANVTDASNLSQVPTPLVRSHQLRAVGGESIKKYSSFHFLWYIYVYFLCMYVCVCVCVCVGVAKWKIPETFEKRGIKTPSSFFVPFILRIKKICIDI